MVSRHKLCGLLVLGGAGPLALFLYILAWAQNYSATTEGQLASLLSDIFINFLFKLILSLFLSLLLSETLTEGCNI